MIKTKIIAGAGEWNIEFSDNGTDFVKCALIRIGHGMKKVTWND